MNQEPEPSFQETSELIQRDFEMSAQTGILSETELHQALADHLSFMLEHHLETLMSTLYRLDVSERKVAAALSPQNPEPANEALAHLIIQRQKQRVMTKQTYRQPTADWFDLD